jgi:TolB-like protein
MPRWGMLAIGLVALAGALGDAAAEPDAEPDAAPAAVGAISAEIAVMPFDALGMEAEPVARLEALFRNEIERLARRSLPTRREIDRAVAGSRRLRECAGEDRCLAEIGRRLGVGVVVSGSVAALGDSYIINIKVVDATSGEQIRRIASDPLRGRRDELIEAVRVAAYRLLAPDELRGSIMVLTDLVGARITLGGEHVGTSPMEGRLDRLPLGEHVLRVEADGYDAFEETVEVRFQKTTRVVVSMLGEEHGAAPAVLGAEPPVRRPAPRRWYNATWVYVGAGLTAAVVGGYVGYRLGHDSITDCSARPEACRGL